APPGKRSRRRWAWPCSWEAGPRRSTVPSPCGPPTSSWPRSRSVKAFIRSRPGPPDQGTSPGSSRDGKRPRPRPGPHPVSKGKGITSSPAGTCRQDEKSGAPGSRPGPLAHQTLGGGQGPEPVAELGEEPFILGPERGQPVTIDVDLAVDLLAVADGHHQLGAGAQEALEVPLILADVGHVGDLAR